ncbi:hypothetical protein ABFY72_00810 [Burkholderia gladioli]
MAQQAMRHASPQPNESVPRAGEQRLGGGHQRGIAVIGDALALEPADQRRQVTMLRIARIHLVLHPFLELAGGRLIFGR